jgi:hypothetical protein
MMLTLRVLCISSWSHVVTEPCYMLYKAHVGDEMESLEKEGVMRIFIAKPYLRNILIHSATSSCIIELCEKWYTFLHGFFPKLRLFAEFSPYMYY